MKIGYARKSTHLQDVAHQVDELTKAGWGSTPEPPKFLLPQLQPRNQCIQVNNFIAALEGIMSVKQNMLPGHR